MPISSKPVIPYDPEQVQPYPKDFNLHDVPLTALRQKARSMLSAMLNPPKILFTEEGLARDWRGVVHCANLQHTDANLIHSHHDHMASVLKFWCQAQNGLRQQPNFAQLVAALEMIDRFDVADDIREALEEDAKLYITNEHLNSLQNITESLKPPPTAKPDEDILTIDDVIRSSQNLPPQLYDAFVLYADEDLEFAVKLIERMENFGLKLFVKDRDLVGGVPFEHEAILRLISERCNRVVVICSPAFLKSPANTFFVNFAQALGIEKQRRKIIPCIYQNCEIPPTLKYCFLLKYQQTRRLFDFWDKLYTTIRDTTGDIQVKQLMPQPTITITEVDSTASTVYDSEVMDLTPLAVPRRLRDKLTNSKSIHDITFSDENHNSQLDNSNELVDSHRIQIMPPRPPIRSSSSMGNLSNTPPNGNCLPCSNPSLGGSAKSISNTSKTAWFKKLLSPNSSSSNGEHNAKKKKKKKSWLKTKLATYS